MLQPMWPPAKHKLGEAFPDCYRSYEKLSSKATVSAKFCLFSNRTQPRHDHRGRESICWVLSSTARLLENFCILVGNNNTNQTSFSQQCWERPESVGGSRMYQSENQRHLIPYKQLWHQLPRGKYTGMKLLYCSNLPSSVLFSNSWIQFWTLYRLVVAWSFAHG